MPLFSTTGIRGISNKDMNPEFCLDLGRTFGTLIGKGKRILIGMDTRTSSEMLKNSVVSGLLSSGCSVYDTGVVPIPIINYGSKKYDAGVMITSSHNPPEWNGIKFLLGNGTEISTNMERKFERILKSKKFTKAPWKNIGKYHEKDSMQDYINQVAKLVRINRTRGAKLKVIADVGNGAQGTLVPKLLNTLGCSGIILHGTLNGHFERVPEPRPDTLTKLVKEVKAQKADLGVAYDVDGDRAIFVTEKGNVLMGDVTGSMLARELLKKNKKGTIVTTVATSSLIDDVAGLQKGKVIRTVVGAKFVGDTMLKKKALFGFEENGGCIFPRMSYARDGSLTMAKILELLALSGKTLTELRKELPIYYQEKGRVMCPDTKKTKVTSAVKKKVKKQRMKIDQTDGLKIFLEDGWVLIRASGTEPLFRVFTESKNKKSAKELLRWGMNQVKKAV